MTLTFPSTYSDLLYFDCGPNANVFMASPLHPKLTHIVSSNVWCSLKITDEMLVDGNRIPELHFPGEEEEKKIKKKKNKWHLWQTFLSQTAVKFFLLHKLLYSEWKKSSSIKAGAKRFKVMQKSQMKRLQPLERLVFHVEPSRKTGQLQTRSVETRVHKSACIKENNFVHIFT